MADHFRAVGFEIRSVEEFGQFAGFVKEVLEKHIGQPGVMGPHGKLGIWGPDQGVELYLHSSRDGMPIGLLPHFVGTSRLHLCVAEKFTDPRAPMDGYVRGTVIPLRGEDAAGSYPLIVAMPDSEASFAELRPGQFVVLQVAAFAEQLHAFASDADFRSRGGEMAKLASEALIPIGMFQPNGQPIQPPQPRALFVGHVESVETRVNSFSDLPFVFASVKTLGGWYDVVADPTLVQGNIVPGGVVYGVFWLSAEIMPNQRLQKRGLPPIMRPNFDANDPNVVLADAAGE